MIKTVQITVVQMYSTMGCFITSWGEPQPQNTE